MKRLLPLYWVAVLIATSAMAVAKSSEFPPVFVDRPFDNAKKLQDFSDKFGDQIDITSDFVKNAGLILKFGYDFELEPCWSDRSCSPKSPAAWVYKTAEIDLSSTENELRSAAARMRKEGCSFINVSSLSRTALIDNVAIYRTNISGKKRACDDLLGKHDIASISGHALLFLNLKRFDVLLNSGRPSVEINVNHEIHVESEFFGLIDVNSFLGKALQFAVGQTIYPGLGILFLINFDTPQIDTLAAANQIALFQESFRLTGLSFNDFLAKSETLKLITRNYVSDSSRTKLKGERQNLSLFSVSKSPVGQEQLTAYYSTKSNEIAILSSLGTTPKHRQVVKGDTFWKIALEEYGHPDLYHLLLAANPSLKERLSPGDVVTLPPRFEMFGRNDNFIRPGESLWGRWKRDPRGLPWKTFQQAMKPLRSSHPDVIYPLQVSGE